MIHGREHECSFANFHFSINSFVRARATVIAPEMTARNHPSGSILHGCFYSRHEESETVIPAFFPGRGGCIYMPRVVHLVITMETLSLCIGPYIDSQRSA